MRRVIEFQGLKDTQGYTFHCPGCRSNHTVYTQGSGVPAWKFNGNEEKPTFYPSVKVQGCIGKDENGKDIYGTCHSRINDGKIEYLGDCTHHLKGQTVELPKID